MREDSIHKIEVHVAGFCFDGNKVLVLKRSPSRKIYPNLWECGGGAVWPGENFEEALKREMKDEAGVIVKPVMSLKTYQIIVSDSEQKNIPGLRFVCKFLGFVNGKEPQISAEHTEWKWIAVDKLDGLDFIPGVKEDIKEAYSALSK
ncbi:MAG: NUDIX domain-containing protein [Candidatus Aenigmatarchaeota archaeon]